MYKDIQATSLSDCLSDWKIDKLLQFLQLLLYITATKGTTETNAIREGDYRGWTNSCGQNSHKTKQ